MPHARTVAAAAVLTGLALGQQACSPGDPSGGGAATTPASSTGPATSAPAPSPTRTAAPSGDNGPILSGSRQVVIRPVDSVESILAVDDKGRLVATDGPAEYTLFVLAPARDGTHLIMTAKAGPSNEPFCMGVQNNGSKPLTVVAALCDADRDGQLFTIAEKTGTDSSGRPAYAISNQGAYLQLSSRYGLIVEELGDSPLETTYSFVDNGPAVPGPGA